MHIGSWMRSPQPLFLLAKRRHSYITTPIFYVNAAPHLGHLYTAVLSDAANRWMKMKDPEGLHILITGTDEHGIKILRAAEKANKDPQVFCDETSGTFRELFKKFGIQNTDFIRTSDARHKRCVEHVWKRLYDRDFIYKDVYSGWYSATDECFFTDNEIQDTPSGKVVKGSNHPVEFVEEQNYMFRLSPLKGKVRQWLTKSDVIYPKLYLPQALQFLEYDGDLSVSRSRSRLPWGIPVPGDDTQTVYVWMDALMNYLSAVGYPETLKSWPPTWQILGKDILKFHAFYWPAFLIALELPLPEKLFVHGHWLIDGVKMSKSLGNVVNPFNAAKSYSADGLRYFLLKQGVPHGDSNFSNEKAIHVINSDLVNNVGNLLSRATVKKLNPSQEYPKYKEAKDILEAAVPFLSGLKNLEASTEELYYELLFYKAIEGIMAVIKGGNGFFQLTQPWKLEPGPELSAVLYITYEAIRVASILLQPVVPTLADQALTRLGIPPNKRDFKEAVFSFNNGGHRLGEDVGPLLRRIDS